MFREPRSGKSLSIPKMGHASVGYDICIPGRTTVSGQRNQPDNIDTKLGIRLFRKNFFLNPTGPCKTRCSGWRNEENQTRDAGILVESGFEVVRSVDIDQNWRGRSRRFRRYGGCGGGARCSWWRRTARTKQGAQHKNQASNEEHELALSHLNLLGVRRSPDALTCA